LFNSEVSGESAAFIFRVTEIDFKILANLHSHPEGECRMPLQNVRIINT
jgi:hypothetical protein